MKNKNATEFKKRSQMSFAQEMITGLGIYSVSIIESNKWWAAMGWFDRKTGGAVATPEENTETSHLKFMHCKGATPNKAVRNLLKLLPRRVTIT